MDEMKQPKKLLEKSDATPSMFINDISKMFKCTVHHETEREGISHGCQKMLMLLAHDDGITQLDIVKGTRLSAPTVSVALAKMENDGLVVRKADKHDLRQVRVYITDKGRETDEFMRSKFKETEEKMLRGIPKEEQEQLIATLRKILINMIESEEKQ